MKSDLIKIKEELFETMFDMMFNISKESMFEFKEISNIMSGDKYAVYCLGECRLLATRDRDGETLYMMDNNQIPVLKRMLKQAKLAA